VDVGVVVVGAGNGRPLVEASLGFVEQNCDSLNMMSSSETLPGEPPRIP
jgi:hypothetical protein